MLWKVLKLQGSEISLDRAGQLFSLLNDFQKILLVSKPPKKPWKEVKTKVSRYRTLVAPAFREIFTLDIGMYVKKI